MNFIETHEEYMNRVAADVFECPMCGSEEIETTYKPERDKHICRECVYEWVDEHENEEEI